MFSSSTQHAFHWACHLLHNASQMLDCHTSCLCIYHLKWTYPDQDQLLQPQPASLFDVSESKWAPLPSSTTSLETLLHNTKIRKGGKENRYDEKHRSTEESSYKAPLMPGFLLLNKDVNIRRPEINFCRDWQKRPPRQSGCPYGRQTGDSNERERGLDFSSEPHFRCQ